MYIIIKKSIISSLVLCLLILLACQNNKPSHQYRERLVTVRIDTGYIDKCFKVPFGVVKQYASNRSCICFDWGVDSLLITGTAVRCFKERYYLGRNTEKLWVYKVEDCFSSMIYYFTNKNSPAFAIACMAPDDRKTLVVQSVPMLQKVNYSDVFYGNDNLELKYAFINQAKADKIKLGYPFVVNIMAECNNTANSKVDTNAAQIEFNNEYSGDNNCVAGVLITQKKKQM